MVNGPSCSSYINKGTTSGLGSNFLNGVYAIGSTVYAATNGGLSISTNGGTSFTNYTMSSGLGSNTVAGVYSDGSKVYAATFGGLSFCATAPAAPTNLVATLCPSQVTINFTAGTDGGSAITNYEYTLDGGNNWSAFSPAVTGTTVTITTLSNGTYNINLRAVNSVGPGVTSTTVTATIDNTVTIAYTGPAITTTTNKSASITLSATVTLPEGADASQSQFRFINRDTGQQISGWLAITAGSPSNTGTVTNNTPLTLTLGTYEIFRKYKIGFEVGGTGCYTRNNPADDFFITLAEPDCGCY